MQREALADRLVNYADAAAAFSVVNSLAFLVALAETDVRCSLMDRLNLVVGGQLALGLVAAMAVVVLRRSEIKVRAAMPPLAPDIARYLRSFFVVRVLVVGFATVFTLSSAILALTDSRCT